jgi:hypothetical protein
MSININKAQAEALDDLGSYGEDRDSDVVHLTVTEKLLAQYGAAFKLELAESMRIKQVVASGKLADSITPEITSGDGYTLLQIRVLDYYDFVNKGVKGVKSSANAPNSPYQYKNYGMSKEGRQSLHDYVTSGRAKISSVSKDKARGIGLERKGINLSTKDLVDEQVATLGYLIKAYGIKATNYFTDAFDKVFKDFDVVMADAVGRDIVLTLSQLGKK